MFSGDGDFTTLVEALQRKGRKVSVVSTHGDPAADDLPTICAGRPIISSI